MVCAGIEPANNILKHPECCRHTLRNLPAHRGDHYQSPAKQLSDLYYTFSRKFFHGKKAANLWFTAKIKICVYYILKFFCFSLSFMRVLNSSGPVTFIIGPNERIRITSSVQSLMSYFNETSYVSSPVLTVSFSKCEK